MYSEEVGKCACNQRRPREVKQIYSRFIVRLENNSFKKSSPLTHTQNRSDLRPMLFLQQKQLDGDF